MRSRYLPELKLRLKTKQEGCQFYNLVFYQLFKTYTFNGIMGQAKIGIFLTPEIEEFVDSGKQDVRNGKRFHPLFGFKVNTFFVSTS